jgi:hypothetical protein
MRITAMKVFERPYSLRLLMFCTSCLFLGLGVWGVSVSREVGIRNANVEISNAWYLFAIIPPLVVTVLAFTLPAHIICWRRGILILALFITSLASALSAPLLYVVYDFEHRLREHPPSPNQPDAPSSAMSLRLQLAHQGRGAGDPERWAEGAE